MSGWEAEQTCDEETPLIEGTKTPRGFPHTNPLFQNLFETDQQDVVDAMTYSLPWLRSWAVLYTVRYTVWHSSQFWRLMGQLLIAAILVGLAAYNFLPNPEYLDTSKFGNIVSVLTLFVSLMLSFFLTASVNRWLASVDGFEDLFNSIRTMSLQFHALGAPREHADTCLRYAIMSAHFLCYELSFMKLLADQKQRATDHMWATYLYSPSKERMFSVIYQEEKDLMEQFPGDKTSQMWLWICSLIGRMAEDGELPGMNSPTYGRIMTVAQSAQEGLRLVKSCIVIQMPFIYVHLLSVLVHVTCLLQAINLGLSMGVSYHAIRVYIDHFHYHKDDGLTDAQITPLTTQVQTMIVDGLKGILAPLLFQAFFDIGVTISSPFCQPGAALPVDKLIFKLEMELENNNQMADQLPGWKPPCFSRLPPSTEEP